MLRQRIENSKIEVDGQIAFVPEIERINNVMLKLARERAAFELNQPCHRKPNHFWYSLLSLLPKEDREVFDSVHFQQASGEVGSRNMQRLLVTQITRLAENGEQQNVGIFINDWIDVHDNSQFPILLSILHFMSESASLNFILLLLILLPE